MATLNSLSLACARSLIPALGPVHTEQNGMCSKHGITGVHAPTNMALACYISKQHDISIIHIQKCGISMVNFQTTIVPHYFLVCITINLVNLLCKCKITSAVYYYKTESC